MDFRPSSTRRTQAAQDMPEMPSVIFSGNFVPRFPDALPDDGPVDGLGLIEACLALGEVHLHVADPVNAAEGLRDGHDAVIAGHSLDLDGRHVYFLSDFSIFYHYNHGMHGCQTEIICSSTS